MSATKDQFIQKTGGRAFGEGDAEMQARINQLETLKVSLLSGKLSMEEIEDVQREMCALQGIDFDSYDDPND